jgi:hypothetical protein
MMMGGPNAVVVEHAPKDYAHQQGLTCGEFNARAILEGFGIRYDPPQIPRPRVRLFGYSFVEDISALLVKHGLSAPVRRASHLDDAQRIQIIKEHLDADQPILLAIGNGHLRRGVYSPIARWFIGHFITLYGYHDRAQVFYVYDPYLGGPYPEPLAVGNEVRTFNELLRDWQGPFYYRFIGMDHVYIPAGAD